MTIAIWTNSKNQKITVRVLGKSPTNEGMVMVQKTTAQSGQGMFSVNPDKLVAA